MLVATFNCNSIRSRMETILGWLAQNKPDALCLQETKVQDHEFPAQPIRDAGYHVVYRGQKSYNGVAILSRTEPRDVLFGLDDGGPADEPRLVSAVVDGVTIVNTYVPQGRELDHEMFQYKLAWFRRLRAQFDRKFKASDLLIWTGDLNVAAESIDVHNPTEREDHVCYHVDARNAFAECRAWGFVDVFRKYHPEPGHYTFFDYRTVFAAKRGLGWRIDYIFASPALAEKSKDAWIDVEPRLQPKASDHTLLAADFRV